ncbi:hypothetical protein LUZ61_014674 [Rhynchospora tenuis]|uniref:RNase H type-1 domain-containing protein n=1 Tax=Rhynchospora tenuis TaxID=198213 RepID=A0AAD5WB62_9POAL|nr:hypothetical protein LUZ61_014674 [Rhynchospora tenuis]
MPLVAWDKITVPKSQGGLGLKDMIKFAQTLHMKNLWEIAAGGQSTWVKVLTAKYLYNSDIWSTSRTTRCTHLWRAIVQAREVMKDKVTWQIGDGTKCKAVGQPWHEMWSHFSPNNAAQRRVTVAQLTGTEGRGWNNQKLIELFGFYGALYLAMTFPNGPLLTNRHDRLIFTPSKNGLFTIKAAYLLLVSDSSQIGHNTITRDTCKLIWHCKGIIPRARLFLWRAIREALPVDALFSIRLARQSNGCAICWAPQETVAHVLFKCPMASQVWITSEFGLRTDNLPDTVQELMAFFMNHLDSLQISKLVTIMWQIWKDRCKDCFQGKKSRPVQTLAAASNIIFYQQAAEKHFSKNICAKEDPPVAMRYSCWIDASWVHSGSHGAGMAVLIWESEVLVQYCLKPGKATSPFHAELLAFKCALQKLLELNISDCKIKTDCLELKLIMNDETSVSEVQWQAFHEAMEVKLLWDSYRNDRNWICAHVSREFNHLADHLARYARTRDIDCTGFTFPAFKDL